MNTKLSKKAPLPGWLIPTLIGGMVYLSTVCRTVYIGDSGEFALVFKTLGISHPPGYPLFSLIGHVFGMLTGFFTPAFSANILSVFLATATIPVIFFALRGDHRPNLTAMLCLLWAFSPLFWGETAGVEVYGLNLLLIALLYMLVYSDYPRKWFLVAYLTGLSLAHHPTALAIIPALIYAFFTGKTDNRWKYVKFYSVLFILGLSVYLYLPARASVSPLADWGHPTTLSLLWNHITAVQYQETVALDISNLAASFKLLFTILLANWWWMGLPFIIGGTIVGYKENRSRTIFALILLISNIILAALYRIPDIDPYYLPGLFACFILASNAILWLWDKYIVKANQPLMLGAVGLVVVLMLVLNYSQMNKSHHRLAEDYGKLILDTAGEGTLFTINDNSSFAALYLRYAEDYRPQVEVFDQAVRLKALVDSSRVLTGRPLSDYFSARSAYIKRAPGKTFLVKSHFPYNAELHESDVGLYSHGILYSTTRPTSFTSIPDIWQGGDPGDFKSRQILVNLELCRGDEFLQRTPADPAQAAKSFEKARKMLTKESRGALHNQLGIALRHFKYRDLALSCYDRALQSPRLTNSERAEVVFNISNIHKDRGNDLVAANDFQGALRAFQTALKYDPVNSRLLYNIGVIYVNYLKDPDKGIPYLEAYLKTNPSDHNVRELIKSL